MADRYTVYFDWYCDNCPNKKEVRRSEPSAFEDGTYTNFITCENIELCANLYNRMHDKEVTRILELCKEYGRDEK